MKKKKYNILYIDPPWQYSNRRVIRKDGKKPRFGIGAVNHYKTMSMAKIERLPVPALAADNCALFMWCTFPYLDQQIKLFKKWGFEYKTIGFLWVKINSKNKNPFFGIGYYTKSNAEPCLLGIRGKMKPINNSISSIVVEPRREHSRKPDTVRDRIVDLFGDLPRLEMFSRSRARGWAAHGLERDKFTEESEA